MPSLDIVTSQTSFRSHLCSPRAQAQFHGNIFCRLHFQKETRLGSTWKSHIQLQSKIIFKEASLQKHNISVIKSIATLEPKCLDGAEDGYGCNPSLQHDSGLQVLRASTEGNTEMDEREKLRRMKISKANKGNVPWNKGRKHSPETLQKIRERTRIAMQDPKVKMKLVNLGHAQSEETRIKIGTGVRQGWQRRRERLMVQETCYHEWENIIAEASRKGYSGNDELQWNSYEILDAQLKKEWLESIQKRKTMARPKGGKRAPKSPEQRKKISEAISAKWNDPEYRNRVCSALAKYHGIPVGAERKRRKMAGESQSLQQRVAKKKTAEAKDTGTESKMIKKVVQRKRKTSAPIFKDPMASSKLYMIKKIRDQRAAMEARKREATERAMLLIVEAEKAAKALEVAALKSPLARDSLLEARKLIAEATRSIESIESGLLASQESGNNISLESDETIIHSHGGPQALTAETSADGRQVNGRHVLSSNHRNGDGFNFSDFTKQNSLDGGEPLSMVEGTSSMGRLHNMDTISSLSNGAADGSAVMVSEFDSSALNGSVWYKNKSEDSRPLDSGESDGSPTSLSKTKKIWVRGRLVEVDEG